MSQLTQARRALAKSRRRVWRLLRTVLDPATATAWRDYTAGEHPDIAVQMCRNWLLQYAQRPEDRKAIYAWEREYLRRKWAYDAALTHAEHQARPRSTVGNAASQIAVMIIKERLERGGTVEIPSIGVVLTREDL